jgi:hypothetical protein
MIIYLIFDFGEFPQEKKSFPRLWSRQIRCDSWFAVTWKGVVGGNGLYTPPWRELDTPPPPLATGLYPIRTSFVFLLRKRLIVLVRV